MLLADGAPPRVLDSTRIDLSDPSVPESRQPYHDGFGTARRAGRELSRLLASATQFGHQAVTGLLERYQADGHQLAGAGVVVGSLTDPERLTNEHMRIHGREGQLFRRIVEDGVVGNGLAAMVCRERDIYGLAETSLGQPSPAIRDQVTAFGRAASGPWRAEQKAATIAAWLVLAGANGRLVPRSPERTR